ncbi:MAG: RDD family protein [Actinobacteria bacterium]|nr:RDD family protein [Actinomycetota bacterium]
MTTPAAHDGLRLDPILMSYASWPKRAAAYILDGFILGIGLAAALIVAAVAGGHREDGVFPVVAWVYYLTAPAVYTTYFHGTTGRTPGKRLLGLRVADARDGTPIGFARALVRQVSTFAMWTLFALPGIVDGLWPFFDERRRALHDLLVRSVVIDERD